MPQRVLDEGQSGTAAPTDDVVFPNISSCMTITVVLTDGTRVGGHAVLIPGDGQPNVQQVVTAIRTAVGTRAVRGVHVIGELGVWEGSLPHIPAVPYDSVADVVTDVRRATGTAPVASVDTGDFTQGAGATRIEFLASGRVLRIRKNDGTQTYSTGTW